MLGQLVEENNDATLEELPDLVEASTGIRVGRSTIDRMLKRLNLTLKKNVPRQRKRKRACPTATRRLLAVSARSARQGADFH